MHFYILTLFPDMVMNGLTDSIIGRAMKNGYLKIGSRSISGTMHLTSIRVWMIILMAAEPAC